MGSSFLAMCMHGMQFLHFWMWVDGLWASTAVADGGLGLFRGLLFVCRSEFREFCHTLSPKLLELLTSPKPPPSLLSDVRFRSKPPSASKLWA